MSVASSPLREQVIFVEGAPRSGTTLLVSMLATHPQIAGTVAESHLFDQGVDALFANHQRQARYEGFLSNYVSAACLTDLVRDLCDGVLGEMRAQVKPGAGRIVEKTPAPRHDSRRVIERKLAVYPDATYVHVVRQKDGVVRSLMRAPWTDVTEAEAEEWWRESVEGIRETCAQPGARYVEITYEALAAEPVETVAAVLRDLGLEVDDAVRDRLEAASRERISSFGPSPLGSGPVRAGAGDGPGGEGGGGSASALRRAVAAGRRLASRPASAEHLAQELVVAARRGDTAAVARLTHPEFGFDLRSGAGDLVASGDAAREALLAVARSTFRLQAVSEKWSGIAQGPTTVMLVAATYGDGTRTDLALAARVGEGVVERLAVIAAGDPAGRAPAAWGSPAPSASPP